MCERIKIIDNEIVYDNSSKLDQSNEYSNKYVQNLSTKFPVWFPLRIAFKIAIFIIFYIIGIIFYCTNEGWSVIRTLYYISVTITTTGYGNDHPTNNTSKIFTIFYILFGVPVVFGMAIELSNFYIISCQEFMIEEFYQLIYHHSVFSEKEMIYYKFYLSLILLVLEIMVGALFYSANENWSFLEGVYWSVCTVSGVGYGDNNIQYQSTYIFGIFYILMSCCIFVTTTSNIIDVVKLNEVLPSQKSIPKEIMDILSDNNINTLFKNYNNITPYILLLHILKSVNQIEYNEDFIAIEQAINEVTLEDSSKYLTREDIRNIRKVIYENNNVTINPMIINS